MLPLPLLVLRFKFVDNVQTALPANNLVVGADLFDTCTHFHADRTPLLVHDTLLSL